MPRRVQRRAQPDAVLRFGGKFSITLIVGMALLKRASAERLSCWDREKVAAVERLRQTELPTDRTGLQHIKYEGADIDCFHPMTGMTAPCILRSAAQRNNPIAVALIIYP